MKKLIYRTFVFFALMAVASCVRDDNKCSTCPDNLEPEGVELAISIGNEFELSTRSAITSAEQTQHIEHMYAYVLSSGNMDDNELDENSLKCLYEEKLPWQPVEKLVDEFRCRLKAELDDNPDKNYLLLVVAVDNNKDTYTFPVADGMHSTDIHLGLLGKENLKLSDLQFKLQADASSMAYTELFAGATVFQSRDQLIEVQLTRRVAGLLCYVTDIPASIDGYDIIGMRLQATSALKTTYSLAPDLTGPAPGIKSFQQPYATDEATGADNNVIAEVDLEALGAEAGPDGQHLYIPGITQEGVLQTVQNSALLGAYTLPVESTGLKLVLKGRKTETAGTGEVTTDEKYFDAEGNGSYTINNEEGNSTYPLRANHIYSLGSKPLSDNTDNDRPASLDGTPLIIEAAQWNEVQEDFTFPSVTLTATITTEKNVSSYIYNCISCTDEITVHDTEGNNDGWSLSTADCNWLFIRLKGQPEWTQMVEGKGEQVVEILMNDYVDINSPLAAEPADDYRTVNLTLTTKNSGLTLSYPIRQYNALIATVPNNADRNQFTKIGFSRLDRYDAFDNDGNVVHNTTNEEGRIQWGFSGTYPTSIFGDWNKNTDYNGKLNYNNVEHAILVNDEKKEASAIYKSRINAIQWNNESGWVNEADGNFWYLPTQYELSYFMDEYREEPSAHIAQDYYWSSTARGGSNQNSYVSGYDTGSGQWVGSETHINRDTYCRIRQAYRP